MAAPAKRGYHHGDLRNALVEAAAALAEQSGPGAVTVRAAARSVGVTPTAAYRHFENHDQLLDAAKHHARGRMASSMLACLDALPEIEDPVRRALSRLSAVAQGYVLFATSEPGLFRTAFVQGGSIIDKDLDPDETAFHLLIGGLDELVEVGYLTPSHRPFAEITAWSTVHGFAMLVIEGPLQDWPQEMRDAAMARMFAILVRGMTSDEKSDRLVELVLSDIAQGGSRPPDSRPGEEV